MRVDDDGDWSGSGCRESTKKERIWGLGWKKGNKTATHNTNTPLIKSINKKFIYFILFFPKVWIFFILILWFRIYVAYKIFLTLNKFKIIERKLWFWAFDRIFKFIYLIFLMKVNWINSKNNRYKIKLSSLEMFQKRLNMNNSDFTKSLN